MVERSVRTDNVYPVAAADEATARTYAADEYEYASAPYALGYSEDETLYAYAYTTDGNDTDFENRAGDHLDDDALVRPAYPSEWSIADVLSHIGSGAVIFGRILDDGCNSCGFSKVYCRCVAYIEGGNTLCCGSCSHT